MPTLDRLLACYGVDIERLGRALKEVQAKRIANTNTAGIDPEFTAKVKQALIELGYVKPEEPPKG